MPRCGCKLCGGAHARKRTPPTYSPAHAGRAERQRVAVHGHDVSLRHEPLDADLDALHRRVDEARTCRSWSSPRRARATARWRSAARGARPSPAARRRSGSGARGTRGTPRAGARGPPRSRYASTSSKSRHSQVGKRKRSWSACPQRTSGCRVRRRARTTRRARGRARPARSPSGRAAASRTRAARRSPAGRAASTGSKSLSMQISARCVLPETSTNRCRKRASQSHGGGGLGRRARTRGRARSRARRARRDAPRRARGACDVGPTKSPVKRNESDGWCCTNVMRLAQKIGALHERARQRRRAAERDVVAAAAARLAPVELVLLGVQAGVQRGVEHRLHQRGVLARRCASAGCSPRARRDRA